MASPAPKNKTGTLIPNIQFLQTPLSPLVDRDADA